MTSQKPDILDRIERDYAEDLELCDDSDDDSGLMKTWEKTLLEKTRLHRHT